MGKKYECTKLIDVLTGLIEALTTRDPELIDKIESEFHNPKTRLISRNREDLYSSESMKHHGKQMDNGWWINNTLSFQVTIKKCERICELAGIKFDKQFKVLYTPE